MSRRKSQTHHQHRIEFLKCRDLYIVTTSNGFHVGSAPTLAAARKLVTIIEAHQQPRPVGASVVPKGQ